MSNNPLLGIKALGQSIWLDYIERGMLARGEIARLIENDGLAGITSNPAIFEKAIIGHMDYDAAIAALAQRDASSQEVYEALILEDVGAAVDLFLPLYRQTQGRDGFVSIEVSPLLADNTELTLIEARRLWDRLRRPNVMIKIPATTAGVRAIRQLIADGINVNVTLLFGLDRYREVMQAFMFGLEDRVAAGRPLESVASVAIFS